MSLPDLRVAPQYLSVQQPQQPFVPTVVEELSIATHFFLLIGRHTIATHVIESLARKIFDEKRATTQSVLGTIERAQIFRASRITLIKTCQVPGLRTPTLMDQQEPNRIFTVDNGDRSIHISVSSQGFSHRECTFKTVSLLTHPRRTF